MVGHVGGLVDDLFWTERTDADAPAASAFEIAAFTRASPAVDRRKLLIAIRRNPR